MVPNAGLTAGRGLAGAGCGGKAGLTDELLAGLAGGLVAGGGGDGFAAGLAAEGAGGFAAGWAGGFAPVPVPAKGAGGWVAALADGGLAGGWAVCGGWLFSSAGASWSPMNCSSSLPAMAAFMTVIQMGRAALAPVSFSPRDWRLS